MSSALYIPQIGHFPSPACDGSLSNLGNDMHGCACGRVLTSAFNRRRSANSVIAEIVAVNRAMNDRNKSVHQTHDEVRSIMLRGR